MYITRDFSQYMFEGKELLVLIHETERANIVCTLYIACS